MLDKKASDWFKFAISATIDTVVKFDRNGKPAYEYDVIIGDGKTINTKPRKITDGIPMIIINDNNK